jgi:serine/threonine protein phosphatase PrpC
MNPTCPFCGAPVQPRSRFCPACGRQLPAPASAAQPAPVIGPVPPGEPEAPVEGAIQSKKRITIRNDSLNLHEIINVVESGVRWWQDKLTSADITTRERAAQSIEELSQILYSLSKQLAQGRETVRITTRLPVLRSYEIGCPVCGRGNRAGAKFCQACGALLAGPVQEEMGTVTPMPLRFRIAARTDQGRVRKNNQDSIYTGTIKLPDGAARLALVADGMGGAKAGEQASRIASEVAQAQLQHGVNGAAPPNDTAWQELLRSAARAANQRVYEESRADAERKGMGTTLTIALIVGERLHVASVGDSRAYLLNANGVTADGATTTQLTSDHSLVARLVDIGQITPEQARTHPQRNLLYRSIGTDPSIEVDTLSEQLEPGDVVLLCSDGLINHVRDQEIAQIALDQSNPNRACEQLVALANERGGRDNISVVIIRVEGSKGSISSV